jgi:hypothetical protein
VGDAARRHIPSFPKPKSGRIAVKVVNHLGDEVMKVFKTKQPNLLIKEILDVSKSDRRKAREKLQQNIDAVHGELEKDLRAGDPKAQEFFDYFGKEINSVRIAEGKRPIRRDGN